MKFIVSTIIAAAIGFVLWVFVGIQDSKAEFKFGSTLADGVYSALLQTDSPNNEDKTLCQVYAKVRNGNIIGVDSTSRAKIWKNNNKPAIVTNGCFSDNCTKFARIKTSRGNAYKVIINNDCVGTFRRGETF